MKKHLFKLMLLAVAVVSFTACSDDDDNNTMPVINYASNGAYIVNAGNNGSQINGSLTYFDYNTSAATQNVFRTANSRELGLTVNDGVAYGSKIYVVVDGENTVEVFDKKTFKSIKQIKTTDLLGDTNGASPRHIVAGYGHVFFTTYGGYVAAVDTTQFTLTRSWKVGAYPEGLTLVNNIIYVANSDFGNGNGTISAFNVNSDQVQTVTVKGIENPQKVYVTNDGQFAVLDWGHYLNEAPWTQENTGLKFVDFSTNDIIKTVPATMADYNPFNGNFYLVNAPYGTGITKYSVFNPSTNQNSTLQLSETPDDPANIKVDPIKGYVYILSRAIGESGYPDYSANGYCLIFNLNGNLVKKVDTGVGPTDVFFDSYAYITQQ